MFSGIVQSVGKILQYRQRGPDRRVSFAAPQTFAVRLLPGSSVAVNGVCLTVKESSARTFVADVAAETLRCTTFDTLHAGAAVNLEHALRAGDAIGGHLVSGHVDAVGTVVSCCNEGASVQVKIQAPAQLMPLIAVKGSISIDGVSMTVHAVCETTFTVHVIPYTFASTTFSAYRAGSTVNLETDMIARYIARQLAARMTP